MRIECSNVRASVRSGDLLASFDAHVLEQPRERVKLVLNGVAKTPASLVLRISLAADALAPVVAGNLYTFGEGAPVGPRVAERFFPIALTLDITSALRRLRGAAQVNVTLQVFDPHGRELRDEAISIESVELDAD